MENIQTFKYQTQTNEEKQMTSLLTKFSEKKTPGSLSVCPTLSKFEENWNAFTENQFKGLNWNNIFVAGGSVLSCLQNDFSTSIEQGNPFNSSDIDLFIYGLSPFQANEKLKHIHEIVKRNTNGSGTVIRSSHAITILGEFPYRHTQVILRIYQSPAEILMGFDIDCCCVGFNGSTVYALPRARRALTKQYNLVDLSRRSLTYETRLQKYSKRGFEVKIPSLDQSKVSEYLYHRNISDVTGLAKLLIMDRIQTTGTSVRGVSKQQKLISNNNSGAASSSNNNRQDVTDSDYAEMHLPWGPNFFIAQIVNSMGNINKKNVFLAANSGDTPYHTFISDLHGVLSGRNSNNCICSLCKGGNAPSISTKDETCGKLSWVTENPGRQILTGSFHPISDDQYYTDAYRNWEPIPGAYFVPCNLGSNTRKSSGPKIPQKTAVVAIPKKATTAVPKKVKKKFSKPAITSQPATATTSAFDSLNQGNLNFGFGQTQPPVSTQQTQSSFGFGFGQSQPSTSGISQNFAQANVNQFGQTNNNAFGVQSGSQSFGFGQTSAETPTEIIQPRSDVSKLLLLVRQLHLDGLLSDHEKTAIKHLIIQRNSNVISALEVFEIERDMEELADSLKLICKCK